MTRAGLSVARLAMAIAPHARTIWIACGPGNNGGDGFQAAKHLKLWGKSPVVTAVDPTGGLSTEAQASRKSAFQAGVVFASGVPEHFDLCIDAVFGIGKLRALDAPFTHWVNAINRGSAPVLSIDAPSGLNSDTGAAQSHCVRANVTLSLLTLKPGLFTGDGRAFSGEVWFDPLDVVEAGAPCAWLNESPFRGVRAHNTHKGSFGDVCVVGGATGMAGAAVLASQAALKGGAGRVFLALLDRSIQQLNTDCPEVMFRNFDDIPLESMVVVAGCGGGVEIIPHMQTLLNRAAHLVLDADGLNAVSKSSDLQRQLASRLTNTTVLTPHPLEAAHLTNLPCAYVQANRLEVAQSLADKFACTVVLKGSGTIIAAPGVLPCINTTGDARLATGGTGDVLAGLIGARLASSGQAFQSACESVFVHGRVADTWPSGKSMSASDLANALAY